MVEYKKVKINDIEIANNLPMVLIAGPCQMESRQHALETAQAIKEIADNLGISYIYKTSFDKANRTSLSSKRGVGLDAALSVFAEIKAKIGCPVFTDIHTVEQCSIAATVVDVLQIPAFLSRQTDLLVAAGNTGKIVNIKKGQFLAPWDMKNVAAKVAHTGNEQIMLTDRGVSFGYNSLVSDMRALPIMAKTGYPVVFDATHSVQQPGGLDTASGGQREFVRTLAHAATAVGIAALYIETHQDPDNAPSDGQCMIHLHKLSTLLSEVMRFDQLAKQLINT